MTSILFLMETIFCNIFWFNYLRNKSLSQFFFSILEISIKFCSFSKKKMTLIADEFLNLRTLKNVAR